MCLSAEMAQNDEYEKWDIYINSQAALDTET